MKIKKELGFGITITGEYGIVSLNYHSRYASGGIGTTNVYGLIQAIEELCGKGSYCLYKGKGDKYPKAISHSDFPDWKPPITYWQQGIKTQVIEEARRVAIQVWGIIPELEIGWMENQCRSYIIDEQLDDDFRDRHPDSHSDSLWD